MSDRVTESSVGWLPVVGRAENTILPMTDQYIGQYGSGQQLYSGSRNQAPDANVWAGLQGLLDLAPSLDGRFDSTEQALQGFLNYDFDSPMNRAARTATDQRISRRFNDVIAPSIEDQFTSAGQFGGNQQSIALGAAAGGLADAIAQSEVDLMNADRNRQMAAMRSAPAIINAGIQNDLLPSRIQGEVGRDRTNLLQRDLNDRIQEFEAGRNNQLRSLGEAQSLLLPWSQLSTTAVGQGMGGGGGGIGGAITGALGGGLLGNEIFGQGAFGGMLGGYAGPAIGAALGALGSFL